MLQSHHKGPQSTSASSCQTKRFQFLFIATHTDTTISWQTHWLITSFRVGFVSANSVIAEVVNQYRVQTWPKFRKNHPVFYRYDTNIL